MKVNKTLKNAKIDKSTQNINLDYNEFKNEFKTILKNELNLFFSELKNTESKKLSEISEKIANIERNFSILNKNIEHISSNIESLYKILFSAGNNILIIKEQQKKLRSDLLNVSNMQVEITNKLFKYYEIQKKLERDFHLLQVDFFEKLNELELKLKKLNDIEYLVNKKSTEIKNNFSNFVESNFKKINEINIIKENLKKLQNDITNDLKEVKNKEQLQSMNEYLIKLKEQIDIVREIKEKVQNFEKQVKEIELNISNNLQNFNKQLSFISIKIDEFKKNLNNIRSNINTMFSKITGYKIKKTFFDLFRK